ncbi:MAG: hypothetical protein OEV66_01515 [Spirochaetia bacterium]|nr:hypothetical protein [Spirochaetia bacterium]
MKKTRRTPIVPAKKYTEKGYQYITGRQINKINANNLKYVFSVFCLNMEKKYDASNPVKREMSNDGKMKDIPIKTRLTKGGSMTKSAVKK